MTLYLVQRRGMGITDRNLDLWKKLGKPGTQGGETKVEDIITVFSMCRYLTDDVSIAGE
jgi:hypothetical protein